MSKIAVFIDRDGVISHEVGYVNHVSRLNVFPFSGEAIRLLNERGIPAVAVTNQAGVARGYFEEGLIGRVHERMRSQLAESGARLDGVYYCPHHPSAGQPPYRRDCDCRKPRPGMFLRAAGELGLAVEGSFMIGDRYDSDMKAAHDLNMRGVVVKTGYGLGEIERRAPLGPTAPEHIAENLLDAVRWILERTKE